MIDVQNIAVQFKLGGQTINAIDGIDLKISPGEVFVLLGPSGCGKTTLLRCLAGLERPSSGTIAIDQNVMSNDTKFTPPHDRPVAMMFQSYAMWPHMNVYENVAFPLRVGTHCIPKDEIDQRVLSVLSMLEISTLKDRPVTTLSGGQQQRVGLARALALQPKVLLMDEPLSNLDHQLQIQLRIQLRELLHRLGLTTVHVTHNQEEALELGDRIAVLNRGKVVQVADGRTLYTQPANSFVARFLGDMNLLPGTVTDMDPDFAAIETRLGTLRARRGAATTLAHGEKCYFGVRPTDVMVRPASSDIKGTNAFRARIIGRRFLGSAMILNLEAHNNVRLFVSVHHGASFEDGAEVVVNVPLEHSVVVPNADDMPTDVGAA